MVCVENRDRWKIQKVWKNTVWVLYTFYYIHIFPIWRISWLSSLFSHDWGAKLSIAKGILSSQRLQIVSSLLIILSPFLFILQPFLLPPSVCFGSPFNHVGTLMAAKKQQILKHFTHLIFQVRHIAYIYMSLLCCDEKFVPKFVPWISCAKLHLLLLWKSRKYSKVTIIITMQRHHRHHHSILK